MICQHCGREAPTRKVFFMQHIGALVVFFHKRIGGLFCRDCVNEIFGKYTLTTAVLGWWGLISLFATPVVLTVNIVNRLRAWSLAPVPEGARPPALTEEAMGRMAPFIVPIVERLNKGEPLAQVAADIGRQAAVTPGQVVRYVQALVAAENPKRA